MSERVGRVDVFEVGLGREVFSDHGGVTYALNRCVDVAGVSGE